jgi:2-haloacid dehalogenase
MNSNIKVIIFDFGGVLLNWDPHQLYRRYFDQPQKVDQFLAEINFTEWNKEQDRGRPFAEAIAMLSDQFPHYEHLIRAYYDQFEETIVGPVPGMADILSELKQAGYTLYGLSNWSAETYPRVKYKYDFFKLFDGIILSGEVKLTKPDPAIFQVALQKIGRPAGECLLIDDLDANIRTAKRMGFAVIRFESAEKLREELKIVL